MTSPNSVSVSTLRQFRISFSGFLSILLITSVTDAQTLVVQEVWRTKGDPTSNLFVGITGMAEASDGSIWISDSRGGHVLSLDSALTLRVVARGGDGPGEVRGPSLIAKTPADGLAIYDISRRSIEVFGPSGKFERRIMLEAYVTNPKGFAALPDGEFILSGGIPGAGYIPGGEIPEGSFAIHRISSSGALAQSWWPIRKTKNPRAGWMVAGGPVTALSDGSLLFSDASPHQIIHFSADGTLLRRLASDPELLKAIGDEFITETGSGTSRVVRFYWDFPQSRLITRLVSGELLNVVEFTEAGRTLFQLYTPDGTPLAHTWVNTPYRAYSITRNGEILADWMDTDTHEQYAVRLKVEYSP